MSVHKLNIQKGFTLVELMISMLLGLILTGGIYSVFTQNAQTSNFVQGSSRVQENARFALSELVSHSRMIGYMGCLSNLDLESPEFVNTVSGSSGSGDIYDLRAGHLDIIDTEFSSVPSEYDLVPQPAPDTDVLVIRGLSTADFNLSSAMPNNSADLKIVGGEGLEIGDIVFLSDCEKASLFQVTNLTIQVGTGESNVVHNTGVGSPGNSQTDLSNSNPFGEEATVQEFTTTIFYIAPATFTNNQGAEVLSLWQKSGSNAAFEFASGIRDLEIWSGEDASGDGIPDRIVRPEDVTDFDNVVSLNIQITADSIDPVDGANLIERDFAATVKLRNKGI